MSRLQKRYIALFTPYFKRHKRIHRTFIMDMPDDDFKSYYFYNKELYGDSDGFKKPVRKKKNLIGIYLEKSVRENRLKRIDFPQSFNTLINSLHIPIDVFKDNFKKILDLYSGIDFYRLKSISARETAKTVISNFK